MDIVSLGNRPLSDVVKTSSLGITLTCSPIGTNNRVQHIQNQDVQASTGLLKCTDFSQGIGWLADWLFVLTHTRIHMRWKDQNMIFSPPFLMQKF